MADPVIIETPAETPADVEAARAAASAASASEAAAQAIGLADVQAARTNDAAAQRIAEFEGRLNEWQNSTTANARRLEEAERLNNETATRHGQALDRLITEVQSIQQRLAPPPEPNPPNPASGQEAGAPPAAPAATAPPANPEPPAEKRRAHRWI